MEINVTGVLGPSPQEPELPSEMHEDIVEVVSMQRKVSGNGCDSGGGESEGGK